jgi:catechol 2,3-dioxygenase-like lactoylglutathione lyase family enzyme
MNAELGSKLLADFEAGTITRRQLVTRLMALGAAGAMLGSSGRAQETATPDDPATERPTFQATGLDHIALDVTDVPRSRDFYLRHLGLRVIRGDERAMFLGAERNFFLTLFRAEKPALNHYCYGIDAYDPDSAVTRLRAAGLEPRRTGGRVYFPDPDGLTVQVASGR